MEKGRKSVKEGGATSPSPAELTCGKAEADRLHMVVVGGRCQIAMCKRKNG
jgi:hypothetical protein